MKHAKIALRTVVQRCTFV